MRNKKSDIQFLILLFVVYGFAQASEEYRVLFIQSKGIDVSTCSKILTIGSILSALLLPLCGRIADRLQSRAKVFSTMVVIWFAVIVLLVFYGGEYILGIPVCGLLIPVFTVCSLVIYQMIEATGVCACAQSVKMDYSRVRLTQSIAFCTINFAYTPIIDAAGEVTPYLVTIGLSLVLLLMTKVMSQYDSSYEIKTIAQNVTEGTRKGDSSYFLTVFIVLNVLFSFGAGVSVFTTYLLEENGLSASMVGTINGIRVAGEILVMPFLPTVKKKISLPMLQAVSTVFRTAHIILAAISHDSTLILCSALFSGLSSGISLGTAAIYLRMMAPKGREAEVLSLKWSTFNIGGILMSFIGGIIISSRGVISLYRIAFVSLLLWIILYFATWYIGVKLLKKEPSVKMFS